MAISLRRTEPDRRPVGLFGPFDGRLAPLALDNAGRKLDVTLVSVTVAGLSRKQIDAAQLAGTVALERLRATLRKMASWWQ